MDLIKNIAKNTYQDHSTAMPSNWEPMGWQVEATINSYILKRQ